MTKATKKLNEMHATLKQISNSGIPLFQHICVQEYRHSQAYILETLHLLKILTYVNLKKKEKRLAQLVTTRRKKQVDQIYR